MDNLASSIADTQPETFGRPVKEILDQIIDLSNAKDLTFASTARDKATYFKDKMSLNNVENSTIIYLHIVFKVVTLLLSDAIVVKGR